MKLIIFTTCKPFIGDDAWRQEQAIKSWTELEGMEKKIIILGADAGTKEICEKYNLIHEPNIKTLHNVPYLHEMFVIANKHSDSDEDVMLWTNSDMIYFQNMIETIKNFKQNFSNIKNYLLVGARIDWLNPKILSSFTCQSFLDNININKYININIQKTDSTKYECAHHPATGIDYVIHSKSTFVNNIDPDLLIAGERHDMILVGCGLQNNFMTCDITNVCPVIHQNHGYGGQIHLEQRKRNNRKCVGIQKSITDCKYKAIVDNDGIKYIQKR